MGQSIDKLRDFFSIVGGVGTLVSTSGTDCASSIPCSVERDLAIGEILGAAETIGSSFAAAGRQFVAYHSRPGPRTPEEFAISSSYRYDRYGKYTV